MLDKSKVQELFDRILKFSKGGELEVIFSSSDYSLTRFANNTIHQNVAEESYHISVRTSFGAGSLTGGRTARGSTNKLDDESLRRVVQSAEALTRVQQPEPDMLAMPSKDEVTTAAIDCSQRPQRYFEATARLTPEERADTVSRIVTIAKKHSLATAGVYSNADAVEGIFNSRGVADWHEQTLAEVSITMLDATSSGWQKANAADVAQLNPAHLAAVAAQKAVDSVHPRELLPGKYTVILEPAAVLDIVGFMFWDFSGSAVLEKRSFLSDRIGMQLFGENITVWDDVYHPLQTGVPFDGEGVQRHPVKLIDKGTVQELVYARASARRMEESELREKVGTIGPTGHGFSLPNEMGEGPLNIVFAPPEQSQIQTTEQMVASTERGLLVTRLWYIREVDPYQKIVTGMTRDGTFLVEDGKVRFGVRNFRFNQSLIQMLQNVERMGQPQRSSGEESLDMIVPAMTVRDFNFTETTKF